MKIIDKIANKLSWLLLPAIIIAAAAIRLFQISRESLWFDELYRVWASQLPARELISEAPSSGHPPLLYLIGHVWFAISNNDAWIRMLSWTTGILVIPLMYLAGKEIFSRHAGIWAAALSASSPCLFWYSREITEYSLMFAATAASLYFLTRSIKRGGWRNWSSYVFFTTVALFSHIYAPFLLLSEVPYFFLMDGWKQGCRRQWIISQAILAGSGIFWLIINSGGSWWIKFNYPDPRRLLLGTFWRGPVVLLWGALPLNHSDVPVPFWVSRGFVQLAIFLVFLGLLVLSARFRAGFLNRKILALALITTLIVGATVLSELLRNYPLSIRYYTLGIVPFLLLMAAVIVAVPRPAGTFIGCAAVISFLLVTAWSLTNYHYDDWRDTMSVISSGRQQEDKLLCFPISECTMAVHHYLHDSMAFSGGFMIPSDSQAVSFFPPRCGVEWFPDLGQIRQAGYSFGTRSRKQAAPRIG